MFGHRYWGRRYFGPRYWGDGGSVVSSTSGSLLYRLISALRKHLVR